jgi:hypothetical protein
VPGGSDLEHSLFVCNVDLWSEDASKEVNLVRQTTPAPAISSTTPASSFMPLEQGGAAAYTPILPSYRDTGPGGYADHTPPGPPYIPASADPSMSMNMSSYSMPPPPLPAMPSHGYQPMQQQPQGTSRCPSPPNKPDSFCFILFVYVTKPKPSSIILPDPESIWPATAVLSR